MKKEKFKLNKKDKKKWVKALRSGLYNQTTNCLKDSVGYCCLGVACEIDIAKNDSLICVNIDFMPLSLQEKLAEFNDTGKSFNWIASYIERYL